MSVFMLYPPLADGFLQPWSSFKIYTMFSVINNLLRTWLACRFYHIAVCCDEEKGELLEKVHVKWFHEHRTCVMWSSFSSLSTSVLCRAYVYQGLLLSWPSQRLSAWSIYLKQFRRMSLQTAVVKSLVNLTHSIKYSCFTEKCVLFVYS